MTVSSASTAESPSSNTDRPGLSGHKAPRRHGKLFLFFGVLLPLLALLFEVNSHYCAQRFFDPFPSNAHIFLFLLIPVTNFLTFLAGRRDLSAFYLFIALGNGMALGIGCLYTLMFLPISGTACMGILFFGFGLLALAPLLSMPCSWLAGKSVCRLASRRSTFFDAHQMEHIGHLIILIMVVAIELPSTLTRFHMGAAAQPASSQSAIAWLRRYGNQEVMLRACYERSGRATDILGSLAEHVHPVSMNEAREIFYKVTGKAFNSVPIPASARATIKHTSVSYDPADLNAGVEDEFDIDSDIAGEVISGTARGLSISDSKLAGKVDADALLATVKWTFAFDNTSKYDREARCKVLLPPDAVVTRAVMTVDGVPHEASIMVRSEARAVYQEAVKERKNPMLVSVCGQDQILVQCFPIRNGKDIRISMTIVSPLTMRDTASASLQLPSFIEKNFQAQTPVTIALDSATPLAAPTSKLNSMIMPAERVAEEGPPAQKFALNGQVEQAQLDNSQMVVQASRDPNCLSVYCRDKMYGFDQIVQRKIDREHYPSPGRLIVIVDGSAQMKDSLGDIVKGLRLLPDNIEAEVILVADDVKVLCPAGTKPGSAAYKEAMQRLETFLPVGGQDDAIILDALRRASIHSAPGDASVLWIHGAQPVASIESDAMKRVLQHPVKQILLYDMQVAPGPNEYLNISDYCPNLVRVVRTGTIGDDLQRLYSAWSTEMVSAAEFETFPVGISSQPDVRGKLTDPALAQLRAYKKVLADSVSPAETERSKAGALAESYHLITPVSSGVVVDDIAQLAGFIAPTRPWLDVLIDNAQHAISSFKSPVDSLNTYTSRSFDEAAKELNRLNAVGSPAEVAMDRATLSVEGDGAGAPPAVPLGGVTNGTISPEALMPQNGPVDYGSAGANANGNGNGNAYGTGGGAFGGAGGGAVFGSADNELAPPHFQSNNFQVQGQALNSQTSSAPQWRERSAAAPAAPYASSSPVESKRAALKTQPQDGVFTWQSRKAQTDLKYKQRMTADFLAEKKAAQENRDQPTDKDSMLLDSPSEMGKPMREAQEETASKSLDTSMAGVPIEDEYVKHGHLDGVDLLLRCLLILAAVIGIAVAVPLIGILVRNSQKDPIPAGQVPTM